MPSFLSKDALKNIDVLSAGDQAYTFHSLKAAEETLGDLSHLPCAMRILLENLLRHEDGERVTGEDMRALAAFHALRRNPPVLALTPGRLAMNQAAALAVLTDIAALREGLAAAKGDPGLINLTIPTDILLDHTPQAQEADLLAWGQGALADLRVISHEKGIAAALCVDSLCAIIAVGQDGDGQAPLAYPEILIGEAPHLATAGSLGVLAFETDSLDLESAGLGESVPLTLPAVLGVKLTGRLPKTVSASALALQLVKLVRAGGGADKIVEFYGPGLDSLTVPDRAVIADLLGETAPLAVFFPIDEQTLAHLRLTGANEARVALVEAYAKAQGLWRESAWPQDTQKEPSFTATTTFDLAEAVPVVGGPGLAYNPAPLADVAAGFAGAVSIKANKKDPLDPVAQGDVIWAALGPFGGALHPVELIAAGLVARRARAQGLSVKPWVRASYTLPDAALCDTLGELRADLDAIGFHDSAQKPPVVAEEIVATIAKRNLTVCAMGTGNAEAGTPVHPLAGANYLTAPATLVAYALAGTISDTQDDPALRSLKTPPLEEAAARADAATLTPLFVRQNDALALPPPAEKSTPCFVWKATSITVQKPSLLDGVKIAPPRQKDIAGAVALAVWGDDVPAAALAPPPHTAHPGNEQAMLRESFAGAALVNSLTPAQPPGRTLFSDEILTIADAARRAREKNAPLFVAAGRNFGNGRQAAWAAKALRLSGVGIVIAESLAPAFRLALLRVGVLPLQLKTGVTLADLKLDGAETVNFSGLADIMRPPIEVLVTINHADSLERYMLRARLDTEAEVTIWRHGSIWAQFLRERIMLAG